MSSSSSQKALTIIIDDKRSDAFQLSGADSWAVAKADQWFNGTIQSPAYAVNQVDSRKLGTLQMKFNGTSVAFFGTTPPSSSSQTMSISIDGGKASNSSYGDPNPQSYRQWYQSPVLPSGNHTISLANIAGTALDFAVVTVGPDTPLAGQTVIVDDDDGAMVFSDAPNGKWKRNMAGFNSGPNPDGVGFGNSTHETGYVGSSFTYRFSGISIGIYGIFTWSNIGLISLTFTLDGAPITQTFRVNADTPQFVQQLGQQQNFKFYSYDFLQKGEHTLTVNVTDCVNQTFAFDYVTYTPDFATLSDMPSLPPVSGGSATKDSGNANKSKSNVGAVAGGAIGGILLLLLIGGLVFFLRRRKRRTSAGVDRKASTSKYSPLDIEPFDNRRAGALAATSIPLANQTSSPPGTGGSSSTYAYYDPADPHSYLGPMALRQNISAEQYGLPLPPGAGAGGAGTRLSYVDARPLVEEDPFNRTPPASAGISGVPSPRSHGTGGATLGEGTLTGGERDGEISPPSYDEVTGGRRPTHITYVVQR